MRFNGKVRQLKSGKNDKQEDHKTNCDVHWTFYLLLPVEIGRYWRPLRPAAIGLAEPAASADEWAVEHSVGDDLGWTALGLAVGRRWHYKDSNRSAATHRMAAREAEGERTGQLTSTQINPPAAYPSLEWHVAHRSIIQISKIAALRQGSGQVTVIGGHGGHRSGQRVVRTTGGRHRVQRVLRVHRY